MQSIYNFKQIYAKQIITSKAMYNSEKKTQKTFVWCLVVCKNNIFIYLK